MAKKADAAPPALVRVRALVPMWGGDDVVPIGMEYGLPEDTALYLESLGMVARVGVDAPAEPALEEEGG